MKKESLVPINDICDYYQAEHSFIISLKEYELIEIITIEGTAFIHSEQLQQLEKLMRLHYDLDVNLEGIEVINRLLHRIETLHHEMLLLKNKLGRNEES